MGWERHHRSIKCIALIYCFPLLSYLWLQHIAFDSIIHFDQEECCQWILFCLPTGCSREELHSLVLHWCCRATSWVQEGIRVPGNAWATASKNNFFMFVTVILIWRVFWILYTIVMKIQAYTSENGWMLEMLIFVFIVQCWLNKFWLFWYVWNHWSHIPIFIPWAWMREAEA